MQFPFLRADSLCHIIGRGSCPLAATWTSTNRGCYWRNCPGEIFENKLYKRRKANLKNCCACCTVSLAFFSSTGQQQQKISGQASNYAVCTSFWFGFVWFGFCRSVQEKYKPQLSERSKFKTLFSLTLSFIPAVHVFLQDYPLLHMNYVNDLNYIPNAHSGKPASCVKLNR